MRFPSCAFPVALSSSRFLGFFQLPCLPQLRRCSTRSFTDIRLCFVCNFGDLTPTHGPVRPLHSGVNRKEVTGAPRRLLRHQLRCDRGGSSGEGSRINVGRTRTRSSAHDLEGARHNGTRNPLRGEHKSRRGAGIKPSEEEEEEQKKEKILPWCWRGREICKEGFALSVGGACSPEPPALPLGHPPLYFIFCISGGSTKGEECAINKVRAGSG